MEFQGFLCCCLVSDSMWVIPFLPHVISLVYLLGYERNKELYEKKTGREDRRPIYILYFAFISGFNNHSAGEEILPEYK